MSFETVTLWEGKHLRVRRCGPWEYVERSNASGGVMILALTDENKLLLVEQYRVPMGKRVIELPAGLVGDREDCKMENLIDAAKRELIEETGYEAREMVFLMGGPSSAGLTNEVNALVRAKGLRQIAEGGGGQGEEIILRSIPLE